MFTKGEPAWPGVGDGLLVWGHSIRQKGWSAPLISTPILYVPKKTTVSYRLIDGQVREALADNPAVARPAPGSLAEYQQQRPTATDEAYEKMRTDRLREDANRLLQFARTGTEKLMHLDNSQHDVNPEKGVVVAPSVPKGWSSGFWKTSDVPEYLRAGDFQRNQGQAAPNALFPLCQSANMEIVTDPYQTKSRKYSDPVPTDGTKGMVQIREAQGLQQIVYSGSEGELVLTPDPANRTLLLEQSSDWSAYLPNNLHLVSGRRMWCD